MRNNRKRSGHPGAGLALTAILLMASLPTLAGGEIAGQVGDKKFTMEEVDAKAKASNASVYQALYDARRQTLDAMIENQLLELEAAARKISVEDLVKQEIDQKIAPVTPEDASAWYDGRSFVVLVLLAALALFSFYTSLGGKPLFGRDLFET